MGYIHRQISIHFTGNKFEGISSFMRFSHDLRSSYTHRHESWLQYMSHVPSRRPQNEYLATCVSLTIRVAFLFLSPAGKTND